MAKKRKRNKKCRNKSRRQARVERIRSGCDCHHLLYQRRFWDSGYGKMLRNHPYLKIDIPIATLHAEIHRELFNIPRPKDEELRRAYFVMNVLLECQHISLDDPYYKRLDFLIDIWEKTEPKTADALKKEREIIYNFYN